jgi:Tfp pilus assembly protein PilF
MLVNPGQVNFRLLAHFRIFAFVFALLVVLMLPCIVSGQGGGGIDFTGTGGRNAINGRIYFPSGQRVDSSLKIQLESQASGAITIFSDSNGSFSFRGLEPGNYTVVIEGGDVFENVRESVLIEDMRGLVPGGRTDVPRVFTLPIYLQPKRKVKNSSKPEVVNAELAAAPAPARDLYAKAMESARAGDNNKAIEQLKAAISVFPEFALALNELGVQYLRLGQPSRAVEVLKSAVKASPDSFTPRLNYGFALLNSKQPAEAETQLRAAIKKSDSSAIAHMYLGIALISQRGADNSQMQSRYEEAEKEFARSLNLGKDQVAMSHKYLCGIYWRNRRYHEAADEMEQYVKLTPNAPEAERKRDLETIKQLRGMK